MTWSLPPGPIPARYSIPRRYAEQLLMVGRHRPTRYTRLMTSRPTATGGVHRGLMAMHIVGFVGSHAIPYAVKLGVATDHQHPSRCG